MPFNDVKLNSVRLYGNEVYLSEIGFKFIPPYNVCTISCYFIEWPGRDMTTSSGNSDRQRFDMACRITCVRTQYVAE